MKRFVVLLFVVLFLAAGSQPKASASMTNNSTGIIQPPLSLWAGYKAVKSKVEVTTAEAVLKTVIADEKVATDKKVEAGRLLAALLSDAVDEKAKAAKVEALKTFYRVTEVREVMLPPVVTPLSSRISDAPCTRIPRARVFKNYLGWVLWRYYHVLEYCRDSNGYITSFTRDTWPEVFAPVWEFNGTIQDYTRGGQGDQSMRSVVQGHFSACLAYQNVGCIQHSYPRIEITTPR